METQLESQNKRILAYLRTGRKITWLGALYQFGSARLPARIYDIKEMGIDIADEWITITSPAVYSGKKRVKQYFIKKVDHDSK
jgi:hypothetical protein